MDVYTIGFTLSWSEPGAEGCHRSLVLDYLAERWGDITPVHL